MRTRSSNKSKRFSVQEYDYGISSDDEAPPRQPKKRGESDDENFENGGDAEGESSNDEAADEQVNNDDDDATEEEVDDGDDDDVLEVVEARNGKAETTAASDASNRPRPGPGADAVVAKEYKEIPPLPKDPRTSRVWNGPLKKWDRFALLTDLMYGPNPDHIQHINRLRNRWRRNPVLPTRGHSAYGGVVAPSWLPEGFGKLQSERFQSWYQDFYLKETASVQRSHLMPAESRSQLLQQPDGDLMTLLGPAGRQHEMRFSRGKTISLHEAGGTPLGPSDSTEDLSAGWMLDIGGIPLAAEWAPMSGKTDQLVAFAVVPFADQAARPAPQPMSAKIVEVPPSVDEGKKVGCVQIWQFPISGDNTGVVRPSRDPPQLVSVMSFDWGRPKRLQWCPVPFPAGGATYGMLAVLCGDGMVHILDVVRKQNRGGDENGAYAWIETPVATLGITDEHNVYATCLTWININRVVLGHSDGSISMWSIRPRRILQRHAVHPNYIIDVCSAYPSHPYTIAANPIGGHAKLVDLTQPSGLVTYNPIPMVNFQPNLLQWSEQLGGFMSVAPSGVPISTIVSFSLAKFFPQHRTVFSVYTQMTSFSVGAVHPFMLVGCADGSVWTANTMRKLMYDRHEKLYRMKLFEHEFRPANEDGSHIRGAARILQGFAPEINESAKAPLLRSLMLQKIAKSKKKKGKRAKKPREEDVDMDDAEGLEGEDGELPGGKDRLTISEPGKYVIHEPLTRITSVTWNPNIEFGWWAVTCMASGLVRVMDLGIDPAE